MSEAICMCYAVRPRFFEVCLAALAVLCQQIHPSPGGNDVSDSALLCALEHDPYGAVIDEDPGECESYMPLAKYGGGCSDAELYASGNGSDAGVSSSAPQRSLGWPAMAHRRWAPDGGCAAHARGPHQGRRVCVGRDGVLASQVWPPDLAGEDGNAG